MGRKTRSSKTRDEAAEIAQARAHFESAAADLAGLRANQEELAEADDDLDTRKYSGNPKPDHADPPAWTVHDLHRYPTDPVRAEYERQERLVEKMAERVKYAGRHVRASALGNLERGERRLDELHERAHPALTTDEYEYETALRTTTNCRSCDREIESGTAWGFADLCPPCYARASRPNATERSHCA
jgi:hypothetical protein